jgi:acyl-coenzyme A synthetase/AMP-(fatty) acid ligase
MVTLLVTNPLLPVTDTSSLRLLSCGGSPQSPAVVHRAVAAFGCEFFLSYGMTECCGKISMSLLPRIGKFTPPAGGCTLVGAEAAARQEGRDAAWEAMVEGLGGVEGLMRLVHTSGRPFLPMEVRHTEGCCCIGT